MMGRIGEGTKLEGRANDVRENVHYLSYNFRPNLWNLERFWFQVRLVRYSVLQIQNTQYKK